jgi:hypothetical protein
LSILTRLFDKKISDTTTDGYKPNEIQELLNGINNIDTFQYYYYAPGSKYPSEEQKTKNQATNEIITFLNQHFTETLSLHTEIHHKTYKSGRNQIIFRGKDPNDEITRLSVIEYSKHQEGR